MVKGCSACGWLTVVWLMSGIACGASNGDVSDAMVGVLRNATSAKHLNQSAITLTSQGKLQLPVAILGLPDIYIGVMRRAMRETGIYVTIFTKERMAGKIDLTPFKVIYLERSVVLFPIQLRRPLLEARERGAKIIAIQWAGAYKDLVNVDLTEHPYLEGYRKSTNIENMKRFLIYTAVKFFGYKGNVLPPVTPPENGIYHPDAPKLFASLDEYVKWRPLVTGKPTVAILFMEFSCSTENTAFLDALIRRLERFANVVATYGELPERLKPDVVISARVYGAWNKERIEQLDVPLVQTIKITHGTLTEWENGPGLVGGTQLGAWITVPEIYGAIEPIVIAWRKRTKEGVVDLPITERIEKLARRIEAWVRLRHKPNAKKRIAIIHYDMSASYLNVPRSLMRLLMALQEHGYNVRVPASEDELLAQLKRARNVSSDDRVGLEMLYNDPNTAKVDASEYCKWFSELPKKLQGDVIKWWGKPPGKIMVWRGKLLIPQVPLGNVAIVPLPWRGESDSPDALYHNLSVPPPHHYIAFYFWLRRRFKADAVIHFGTHGTHEFLPRKQQGLSHTDYPDILIQDMPNIYPYMCVNAVEAITAKRRGYAVIISHNVPPMRTTRLSPELERLHTLIRRYESAESEALKREYRREILQQAKRAKAVGIEIRDVANFDELVRNAHAFLHRLLREEAPIGLHVLGEQPTGDALVATVLAMLHGDLERRLSEIGVTNATPNAVCEQSEPAIATALLRKTILDGESPQQAQMEVLGEGDERITELLTDASEYARRIRKSDEIGAILHALEGGFIPSGIGGCPIRNPNVLPTGRNMHSIDPKTIPTKAAWAVGKRMVVQMLERYRRERGRLPRKVGFVLFGGETIRHHGVMESQILFLLGVEPIWARGGRVAGLRLIPTSQLGRPRIDVVITTTGQYRDVFGDVMKLLQRAVEMAASASDESYVREHIRALQRQLQARGMDADIARQLATIRVFAPAVGVYAAGLEAAIPATNTWRTDEKLARFYIKRMGFAYGREGAWGDEQSELFAMVLKGTDAAVFSRSSKLYGLLDTDHPFGFLGGISLAVRHLSGRSPMLFISNLRSTAQPKVETAREFMAMEANTRYLNPDWIREMMRMGFSGAGEMANWLNNLWGWQVTDSNAVDQRLWEKAYDVYVKDVYRLGLRDWMLRVRPEALRAIARAMLNAIERGYWKAPQGIHITLTAMLHPGKLHRIVPTARRIAVGTKVRTRSITPIAHPIARVRPATPVKPPTRPRYVLGRKLVEIPRQASSREPHIPVASLIALASALFLIGMLRRLREQ